MLSLHKTLEEMGEVHRRRTAPLGEATKRRGGDAEEEKGSLSSRFGE